MAIAKNIPLQDWVFTILVRHACSCSNMRFGTRERAPTHQPGSNLAAVFRKSRILWADSTGQEVEQGMKRRPSDQALWENHSGGYFGDPGPDLPLEQRTRIQGSSVICSIGSRALSDPRRSRPLGRKHPEGGIPCRKTSWLFVQVQMCLRGQKPTPERLEKRRNGLSTGTWRQTGEMSQNLGPCIEKPTEVLSRCRSGRALLMCIFLNNFPSLLNRLECWRRWPCSVIE